MSVGDLAISDDDFNRVSFICAARYPLRTHQGTRVIHDAVRSIPSGLNLELEISELQERSTRRLYDPQLLISRSDSPSQKRHISPGL